MGKGTKRIKTESNPSVYRKERRKLLRCSLCKPNRNENAKRRPKHGRTKPKKKSHR